VATLTAAQIAGIIADYRDTHPISDNNAVIAIAVALAESGGNPDAVGGPNSNGTRDWGLWQINDIHNPTDRQKKSPAANWLMAWRIAGMGTSWSPWATYNSGKYREFMNTARGAWQAPDIPTDEDTWDSPTDRPSGSGTAPVVRELPYPLDFLNPLLVPSNWFRIGMALAGVLLLALVIGSILKNVSPIGKIANLAKGLK
jgi:hypothetical protein